MFRLLLGSGDFYPTSAIANIVMLNSL